jgi:hypothetical protein
MPIYTFKNTQTGDVWDELCSWNDRCSYLQENPHVTTIIDGAPGLVSSQYSSGPKNDEGWHENLSRIAEAHPTSDLANRYGSKSIKAAGTRNAVKRWRDQTGKP